MHYSTTCPMTCPTTSLHHTVNQQDRQLVSNQNIDVQQACLSIRWHAHGAEVQLCGSVVSCECDDLRKDLFEHIGIPLNQASTPRRTKVDFLSLPDNGVGMLC